MYIFRAYQSPCSGTHCGLQCAHMPNFASRNQFGHWYDLSDSQKGKKGPLGTSPLKSCSCCSARAMRAKARTENPPVKNDLRFILGPSPFLIPARVSALCCTPGNARSFHCFTRRFDLLSDSSAAALLAYIFPSGMWRWGANSLSRSGNSTNTARLFPIRFAGPISPQPEDWLQDPPVLQSGETHRAGSIHATSVL